MRYERQQNIFDYLMSTSEERSQAPLVLLGEPNGEPHMMNNPKSWDSVKERKLQRLIHEYTNPS